MVTRINGLYANNFRRKFFRATLACLATLVALYALVGLVSLAEISEGVNHAYISFWHGPWRALFQFLGLI